MINEFAEYEMARCFNDRNQAFALIQAAYSRVGLAESKGQPLRVTKHQLLPSSRIFLAKIKGEVTSTLSLIPDSPAGLPLETIYPYEVEWLRSTGLQIAEVGCFADRRTHPARFMENFCQLTRWILHFALANDIGGLIIAVHPRHAKFYKKFLCFEEIGGLVHYPLVRNRPAVALFMQYQKAEKLAPERFRVLLGETIPVSEFANGEMPSSEREFFSRYLAHEESAPFPLLSTGTLGIGSYQNS